MALIQIPGRGIVLGVPLNGKERFEQFQLKTPDEQLNMISDFLDSTSGIVISLDDNGKCIETQTIEAGQCDFFVVAEKEG